MTDTIKNTLGFAMLLLAFDAGLCMMWALSGQIPATEYFPGAFTRAVLYLLFF